LITYLCWIANRELRRCDVYSQPSGFVPEEPRHRDGNRQGRLLPLVAEVHDQIGEVGFWASAQHATCRQHSSDQQRRATELVGTR
jgi:hypothetical protein